MASDRIISLKEVSNHNKESDLWCIINGKVYDLTDFLPTHPGGKKIILKYAGKDGTKAFLPVHPPDIIEKLLPPQVELGKIEGYSDADNAKHSIPEKPHHFDNIQKQLPSLSSMINLYDFESVAKSVMKREAWAYYSSGADDELTLRDNQSAFHRIMLRPRVMVDVKNVNLSTTILGHSSSLPFYITATALGKLGHPDGEQVLTRAAGKTGLIQMIPTLSSCSLDQLINAKAKDQVQFFQLYVNENMDITKGLVQRAEKGGCKGLFITVDAPQLGRREKDMRMKFTDDTAIQNEKNDKVERNAGAARAISSFINPGLSWKDIPWFRSITKMPLILKGVQTGEDAVLAAKHGLDGIVVSNHGGRQIDTGKSGIEILPEVMEYLNGYYKENPGKKLEVYVDGGIRRGSDIFKALALGAKAVGIGRPFLYAMSTYGQDGVDQAISILKDELEMVMRLMGTPTLNDITPNHLDIKSLGIHASTNSTLWAQSIYEPLISPKAKL